jgi:two-component system, cell cycle sensor histidine kinase and response regulator CckA
VVAPLGRSLAFSPPLTASTAHGRPGAQLISLNATVRQLEQALARVAEPSIKIERRLYDDLDPILADPPGIERMVLALARNAREAMPKGGTLTLETDTVFLDEDFVVQWPGMAAGAYSMLLVRDTRPARRDSKPQMKERSADMDEAKIIAERSGGRLETEMVPGTGRVCRVYFPAVDPTSIGAVAGERSPGSETILLVEDTESLRHMIERVLTGFGYTALVARDGAQALEVSDGHPGNIDLLLSDVVMPGIGGPELAIRLRMRRPTMRVLLMSGYDEHSLASAAGSYASFIAKPFRPEALGRKIRELLDVPESARSPAR